MFKIVRKYYKSWKNQMVGFSDFSISRYDFSKAIFHGVVDLLADMANDVIINEKGGLALSAFKDFLNTHGTILVHKYINDGFVVLSYDGISLKICEASEYYTVNEAIYLHDKSKQIIALKSDAYELYGISDKAMCKAWLQLIDSTGNASQTASSRLGNLLIFSPKTQNGAINFITPEEKDEFEKELQESYGAMRNQKSAMILKQPMDTTHVSLANTDFKLLDKVKLATLVIATYFKVPVSQIPLLDGATASGMSNGGELLQGDILKYKTFERLFQRTFQKIANDMGVKFTYSLYGKPAQKTTTL